MGVAQLWSDVFIFEIVVMVNVERVGEVEESEMFPSSFQTPNHMTLRTVQQIFLMFTITPLRPRLVSIFCHY